MAETPKAEGFYWGQWRIRDDNTNICPKCGHNPYPGEDPDEPPGQEWEVMHVVDNGLDPDEPMMVMVPGVATWQPLENFVWGEFVPSPYMPTRSSR